MVEQPCALLNESNAQIVRRVENSTVILRSSRRGDVLHTTSGSAVDVVDEGELFVTLAPSPTE